MKSSLKRVLCSFLVIAMAMLPFQSGQAGMIGSEAIIASAASQADRTSAQKRQHDERITIDASLCAYRVRADEC